MFELENEIANWKQAFSSDAAVSSEESFELECHLRESIASLLERGLSEQEAFMVGTNRLGHPTELRQEYAKNDPTARWRYRLFWMLAGSLGFKAVGSTVSMVVSLIGIAMAYGGFGGTVSGAVLIVSMFLAWSAIIVIAYEERERFGRRSEGLPVKWIVTIGMFLFLAPVISSFGRVALSRFVGLAWYGEIAVYLSAGGFALNWLLLAICLSALWKLNDRVTWKFD